MWPACVISLHMAPQEVSGVIHEQRNGDFFDMEKGDRKQNILSYRMNGSPNYEPWASSGYSTS